MLAIEITILIVFLLLIIVSGVFGFNYFVEIIKAPRGKRHAKEILLLYVTVFACVVSILFFAHKSYMLITPILTQLGYIY